MEEGIIYENDVSQNYEMSVGLSMTVTHLVMQEVAVVLVISKPGLTEVWRTENPAHCNHQHH